MARVELIMPKMGESVSEATIISWSKNIGDTIELDETIIEIATDKVDSEVPSTHEGKLVEMLFQADDVVQVGQPFAILETDGKDLEETPLVESEALVNKSSNNKSPISIKEENKISEEKIVKSTSDRFYSPLVKSIASQEGIAFEELEKIKGTGNEGRVTKSDILTYIKSRNNQPTNEDIISKTTVTKESSEVNEVKTEITATKVNIPNTGGTEIVEMDRMRKLISAHMTKSKSTSAHITSFVEADMTSIVNWRNSVKDNFKKKEGQNITFTPIIIEAMAKAVKDFPMINVSVDGTNIHIHKNVNIGMAAALPDGNLIVPVIKECQNKNLIGITKSVNDLAVRARKGALKPDDIQGGTITMTNVGTFGNLMGTPIINQPQVAIMACGVIKKKPVVLETADGDVIAIRHMMFLSLSYDHRVVDGALGGQFVRKVADYLEQFDNNQTI
ncbi:MAG: dihydrolipoamide acetyltransferase family protein [Flavobacteriales bacterium]|nr:dihydrolipoamide acetyltransferase family protein [Flavobacteriales bacterium]MDG1933567.1 dihydrolipoamide acetyltransferase family protein [Flavobacteriales bacterium]MDG2086027.1 dihydrolipoamide acetyltransferase family protein [Flavobacteriales bacterium]